MEFSFCLSATEFKPTNHRQDNADYYATILETTNRRGGGRNLKIIAEDSKRSWLRERMSQKKPKMEGKLGLSHPFFIILYISNGNLIVFSQSLMKPRRLKYDRIQE